jgi:hypothetical protein
MSSNALTHIATSGKNVPDQDTLERLETLGYIESFSVHFLEQELSQIESLLRREEDLFAEIDRKRHDRDTLIQKAERATRQSLAEEDMGKAIEIRRIIEKLNERNAETLPEYIEVQGIIEVLTLKKLKLEQYKKGKNIRSVYYRVTQL